MLLGAAERGLQPGTNKTKRLYSTQFFVPNWRFGDGDLRIGLDLYRRRYPFRLIGGGRLSGE